MRTNERWLILQAAQVMMLQQYNSTNKFKEGSLQLTGISEKNIANHMQHMMRQLRKLNTKVVNAQQIRSSVITCWLKNAQLQGSTVHGRPQVRQLDTTISGRQFG